MCNFWEGKSELQDGKGRHALCIFKNEQLVRFGQSDLCNFPEERAGLHDGSPGRDFIVFLGNYPGDWQRELRNS